MLVNITASRGLKGKEIKEVMAAVRAFAAPDASIAQGIAYDDNMGDDIRVTVVATGLGKAKKAMQLVQHADAAHRHPQRADDGVAAGMHASAGVTMGSASVGGHARWTA